MRIKLLVHLNRVSAKKEEIINIKFYSSLFIYAYFYKYEKLFSYENSLTSILFSSIIKAAYTL